MNEQSQKPKRITKREIRRLAEGSILDASPGPGRVLRITFPHDHDLEEAIRVRVEEVLGIKIRSLHYSG